MPVTSAHVRMARAALNWSVRDLARATGFHRNTISNIEVGRYAGNLDSLAVMRKCSPKRRHRFSAWKRSAFARAGGDESGGIDLKARHQARFSALVATPKLALRLGLADPRVRPADEERRSSVYAQEGRVWRLGVRADGTKETRPVARAE